MTGDQWTFMPKWNGRSAFQTTTLTVKRPRAADRWLAPAVANSTIGIVALLLLAWTGSVIARYSERTEAPHLDRGRQRRAVGHEHRRPGRARGGTAAARRRRGSGRRIRTELARSVNADRGSVAGLLCCSDAPAGRPRVAVLGGRLAGVPGRRLPHLHERILAGRRQQALRLSAALSMDRRRLSISSSGIRASARSTGMRRVCWRVDSWRSRSSRPSAGFDGPSARPRQRSRPSPRPDLYFVGRGLSEVAAAGFAFYVTLSIVRAAVGRRRRRRGSPRGIDVLYSAQSADFRLCLAALWLPLTCRPRGDASGRPPLSTQGQ